MMSTFGGGGGVTKKVTSWQGGVKNGQILDNVICELTLSKGKVFNFQRKKAVPQETAAIASKFDVIWSVVIQSKAWWIATFF